MRSAVLIVLGCLASAPALAGTWSNLWRTPDQQGEALLRAGHPARAAARFTDPRLKAYAALRAGRYAQAAKLLVPFKDPSSEYNRGNALARSGHLRAALAAYDAALKQAPHDKDIRHNRDLVARMLRRQPPKRTAHGGRGGRGRHKGGNKTGQGNPGKSPATRTHGKGSHAASGHSGRGASRSGRGGGAHRGSSAGAGPGVSGKQTAGRSGHGSRARPGRNGTAANRPSSAGTGLPKQSPTQARRNAALAAAIARRQAHRGHPASTAPATAMAPRAGARPSAGAHRKSALLEGGTHAPRRRPASEKALALEQWLRQIPNDPAGLLRRQFLIEYMMRHRGASR